MNSLLLKPLPVPQSGINCDPGSWRESNGPLQQVFSWNEFKQVRAHQSGRSFSDVSTYASALNLDGLKAVNGQQPERIMTTFVSGNYFGGVGLKPAAGRLFLRSE